MSLSDSIILKELERGNIVIEPFNIENLNPNSVDLTLNPVFKTPDFSNRSYLDCRAENAWIEQTMPEEGLILHPNQLYLYCCNEVVGCREDSNIRAKVEGKSSVGRLGLFIHVTAGFIDTGFIGSLVLEMVAAVPVKIYPNQKICQIEFARVEGKILEPYNKKKGSKYMNQKGVQESLMYKNFKDEDRTSR